MQVNDDNNNNAMQANDDIHMSDAVSTCLTLALHFINYCRLLTINLSTNTQTNSYS